MPISITITDPCKSDDPETKGDALMLLHSVDMYLSLTDLGEELRRLDRYEELGEEARTVVEKLREFYYSTLSDRGISALINP